MQLCWRRYTYRWLWENVRVFVNGRRINSYSVALTNQVRLSV